MQRNIAFALLLSVATSALAAAPKPAASKYSTRDEYRACLDERDQIDQSRADFDTQLAELDAQQKQYEADRRAQGTKVNGKVMINFADEKSEALRLRSIQLNEASEKLNAVSKDFGAKIESHNQRCAGMVVSVPDRDAVHKERAKQGKKS